MCSLPFHLVFCCSHYAYADLLTTKSNGHSLNFHYNIQQKSQMLFYLGGSTYAYWYYIMRCPKRPPSVPKPLPIRDTKLPKTPWIGVIILDATPVTPLTALPTTWLVPFWAALASPPAVSAVVFAASTAKCPIFSSASPALSTPNPVIPPNIDWFVGEHYA